MELKLDYKKREMKNTILLFLIIAGFVLSSCDDFVDEPKPTASVSVLDAFGTKEAVEAVFTGTYRRIRQFNDGVGDDAEAIGAILNTWNVKGNDFIRPQFDWFVFEYRYQDNTNESGRKTNLIWNEMYEIINTCNTIVANIEESDFSNADKTAFIAEARAIRGMAYHHLIREYAQAYVHGTENPGVPIYLEPATAENANEGNPRSTVGAVYEQIVEDLLFATENLSGARRAKWAINKNVADGLLARVYLYMADYEKAEQYANSARAGYDLDASEYTNGFQDINNSEWMWGAPQSNNQTLYYGSFASFWDGSRYTPIFANPSLVEEFSETDVRNTFTLQGSGPYADLYRTSKFVAAADFGEDLVLMRSAEMMLIEAEAMARQGGAKEAAAADLLFELQSNRDENAVASGNTGQALIEEILLERRKELYGEGGPDYIDFRRLGLGFTRDENHTVPISLESGDSRYIYPIPQAELDSNDEINESDQNP